MRIDRLALDLAFVSSRCLDDIFPFFFDIYPPFFLNVVYGHSNGKCLGEMSSLSFPFLTLYSSLHIAVSSPHVNFRLPIIDFFGIITQTWRGAFLLLFFFLFPFGWEGYYWASCCMVNGINPS